MVLFSMNKQATSTRWYVSIDNTGVFLFGERLLTFKSVILLNVEKYLFIVKSVFVL